MNGERGMEFAGIRVIVTGGASGIGAATTAHLVGRGAKVAVLDLNPEAVPAPALAIRCDVADDASVRAAVEQAARELGGIDVVVNNAGIGAQGTVADNDDAEWHHVFDVNVVGAVRVSRAALPGRALYAASKGAVRALTMSMAADHIREGIRVNCVNPGTADTPWVSRLLGPAEDPVAERAVLEARQPHGRLVAPEEIAAAIAYLASPLAGSTTGTELAVDGGMQALRLRPAG